MLESQKIYLRNQSVAMTYFNLFLNIITVPYCSAPCLCGWALFRQTLFSLMSSSVLGGSCLSPGCPLQRILHGGAWGGRLYQWEWVSCMLGLRQGSTVQPGLGNAQEAALSDHLSGVKLLEPTRLMPGSWAVGRGVLSYTVAFTWFLLSHLGSGHVLRFIQTA